MQGLLIRKLTVILKIQVFWDVTPCLLLNGYRRFRGAVEQPKKPAWPWILRRYSPFETSEGVQLPTRRNSPEYWNLHHQHRCDDKLRSRNRAIKIDVDIFITRHSFADKHFLFSSPRQFFCSWNTVKTNHRLRDHACWWHTLVSDFVQNTLPSHFSCGWNILIIYRWQFAQDGGTVQTDLTFRGLCIVIYSYNKTNEMH